jgi:hypothetical protein
MAPSELENKKLLAAREALDIIEEISNLLVRKRVFPSLPPYHWGSWYHQLTQEAQNTHLTRKQLASCVSLIKNGVNPEALAVCFADFVTETDPALTCEKNLIKELRAQYPDEEILEEHHAG